MIISNFYRLAIIAFLMQWTLVHAQEAQPLQQLRRQIQLLLLAEPLSHVQVEFHSFHFHS